MKPRRQSRGTSITDSVLFHRVCQPGVDDSMLVPWGGPCCRGAKRLPTSRGGKLLQALWAKDKYMAHLDKGRRRAHGALFDSRPSRPTAT